MARNSTKLSDTASNSEFRDLIRDYFPVKIEFPKFYTSVLSTPDWAEDLDCSILSSLPENKTEWSECELKNHASKILTAVIGKRDFVKQGFQLKVHTEENVYDTAEPCLPRNFKFSARGKADIAVVVDNGEHYFPVLMGKLKRQLDADDAFSQLLVYQLALQRPFFVTADSSQLLGFLLDYSDGYIIELTFGLWTDRTLVNCQKVERYSTDTDSKRIAFFCELLDRLTQTSTATELHNNLSAVVFEYLIEPQSPTIRFPPTFGTLFDNCTHILKLNGAELKSLMAKLKSSFPKIEFHYRNLRFIKRVKPDAQLLLKVCGPMISGGIINVVAFAKFLRSASGNIKYLKKHHRAIFTLCDMHPFIFSVTNYIDGEDCSHPSVDNWWRENRKRARELFYSNVYEVGIEALHAGYFHWDIRAKNIILSSKEGEDANKKLIVIDWESGVPLKEARNAARARLLGATNSLFREYKQNELHGDIDWNAQAALVMCENLTECLSHWEPSISPSWFYNQLNEEKIKKKMASVRTLKSLVPLLNDLMRKATTALPPDAASADRPQRGDNQLESVPEAQQESSLPNSLPLVLRLSSMSCSHIQFSFTRHPRDL